MNPVVNNSASVGGQAVQAIRAAGSRQPNGPVVQQGGTTASESGARTSGAVVVQIGSAARARAAADDAGGGGAPPTGSAQPLRGAEAGASTGSGRLAAGSRTTDSDNRVPVNVNAALRAYTANQTNGASGSPEGQRTPSASSREPTAQPSRTDNSDPTGLSTATRTKPIRAGEQDTEATAEQDQSRQRRNEVANLQSVSTNQARLGNQAASIG